jgi:hypothetical protein
MRFRSFLVAAAAAATCAPAALAWAGLPVSSAPKPATAAGPPPAWAETASRSKWLAYSGYCWKTICADYLPPASRPDLPTIRIARGASIRIHFGFRPSKVSVTTLGTTTSTRSLAPTQVVMWRPTAAGVFTFSLKGSHGTVGYAAKIRFG